MKGQEPVRFSQVTNDVEDNVMVEVMMMMMIEEKNVKN